MKHIIFAGLFILAGTGSVANAEWSGYNGSSCKVGNSSASFYISPLRGDFANSGVNDLTVFCPLVRDNEVGGSEKIREVRVNLRDRNDARDGYCRVVSREFNGSTHDIETKTWTGTGNKIVRLGPIDASNFGSYHLVCRLPGRNGGVSSGVPSYIRSYALEEED